MDYCKESLKLHEQLKGKIGTTYKLDVTTTQDSSLVYSPGVAEPFSTINANRMKCMNIHLKEMLLEALVVVPYCWV